jgi:hypothetical protein
VLTAQPGKYRGAWVQADLAANVATFGAVIYRPPASGANVRAIGSTGGCMVRVCPFDQLGTFTSGLAVTSLVSNPDWGTQYPLTGVIDAGQLAAIPVTAYSSATLVASMQGPVGWDLFQPNVLVIAFGSAAQAGQMALHVREFLSAEELHRWPSSRA